MTGNRINPGGGDGAAEALRLDVADEGGEVRVTLAGPLTVATPFAAWAPLLEQARQRPEPGRDVVFRLAGLTALDLNGSAQILDARDAAREAGHQVRLEGLPEEFSAIFHLSEDALKTPMAAPPPRASLVEEVGRTALKIKDDLVELVLFAGELTAEMARLLRHPVRGVRWSNVMSLAEVSGINAVPIVSLVSFLVGLIIAFQAAMLLKLFGAEIWVADLIGVSIIRELGPLIAAIVLAGRSGSAFSAELGAMKAAEEVDAITTMGLSPVRELALPRVLASLMTSPAITLIASFVGILGGSVVLLVMGYSLRIVWQEAAAQVSMATYLICIMKSVLFGFTMAAVGCQRGLAAGDGPGAVGQATTSGVVTNIVLIVVIDSLLAVIFYVYGI